MKDKIRLLGGFHRTEQMDFDGCAAHQIKATLIK